MQDTDWLTRNKRERRAAQDRLAELLPVATKRRIVFRQKNGQVLVSIDGLNFTGRTVREAMHKIERLHKRHVEAHSGDIVDSGPFPCGLCGA